VAEAEAEGNLMAGLTALRHRKNDRRAIPAGLSFCCPRNYFRLTDSFSGKLCEEPPTKNT
jgi:hypothetical protein